MSASGAVERQCTILPRVVVKCDENEEQVDGQCRLRQQCQDKAGFNWLDTKANACKKRPEMALKTASDKLSIAHTKAPSNLVYNSTVEVRLASGDVDGISVVEWTASSSAGWLRLGQRNGTVDSDNPVAEVGLVMDSSGLNDTGTAGLLRANITVVCRMAGRSDLFEKGTHVLTMEVQAAILAEPSVEESDVRVHRYSGEDLLDGGDVVAGDTLLISATAFDFERLPIARAGLQLTVQLTSDVGLRTSEMQYWDGNLYRFEVPRSWVDVEGSYRLRVGSVAASGFKLNGARTVELKFTVTASSQTAYIALGIAAVRAVFCRWRLVQPQLPRFRSIVHLRPQVLMLMALVMAVGLYKNRQRAKEVFIRIIQVEGLIAVEVCALF
jgi:hypothetical protein